MGEADAVLMLDEPGVCPVPGRLRAKPIFLGRHTRRLQYSKNDRGALRSELAIGASDFVVTVVPGGDLGEDKAPIAEAVLSAFAWLPFPDRKLIWVTARDLGYLKERSKAIAGVHIIAFTPQVEKFMALSDVVVAKGPGAAAEAAALGVPSLSLSPHLDPADDRLLPRVPSNIVLHLRAADADTLCHYFKKIADGRVGGGWPPQAEAWAAGHSSDAVAQALAEEIERLVSGAPPPAGRPGGSCSS